MKAFAIFMCVIMFLTAFDLCGESDSCGSENKIEITTKDTEKHQAESGVCSPFCNCSRCSFSVLVPEIIKATSLTVFSLCNFKSLVDAAPTTISSSIWQPPKNA